MKKLAFPKVKAVWNKLPKIPEKVRLFLPGIIISAIIIWVQLGKSYYRKPANRKAPVAYGRVEAFFQVPPGIYLSRKQKESFLQVKEKFFRPTTELLLEEDALFTQDQLKLRFAALKQGLASGLWDQTLADRYIKEPKLMGENGLRLERLNRQWVVHRQKYEHDFEDILNQKQRDFLDARVKDPSTPLPPPPTNMDMIIEDLDDEDRANLPIKQYKKINPELNQPVNPDGSLSLRKVVPMVKSKDEEESNDEP